MRETFISLQRRRSCYVVVQIVSNFIINLASAVLANWSLSPMISTADDAILSADIVAS